MKKKMNTMIKFKRRAMIKGEMMMMMAMMGIREKHHYIQECATMFKEITPLTAYLVISKNDKIMTDRFEMSMMGVLTFFLAFQIKKPRRGTFISQTKYTHDILKKFGMDKAKPIKTPMDTNGHLDLHLSGTSVDQKVYRSMIGSLHYLCASRPDTMLSVCMCARF
jgi:hypothetical protein